MVKQLRGEDYLLGYLKKKERGKRQQQQQELVLVLVQQWWVVGLLLLNCCHFQQRLTSTITIFSLLHVGSYLLQFRCRRLCLEYAIASLLAGG